MRLIVAAFLLLGMVGCVNFQKKVILLSPGDSRSDVMKLMGTPDDTQFNGDKVVWRYWGVVAFGACEYRDIWFENGKLFATISHRYHCSGSCSPCVPSIDWGNPPDRVIEIRNR